ncbi:MAG: hypothetical protein OXF41_17295 [bacterium]|nr:hypothetical protein [bacterium]
MADSTLTVRVRGSRYHLAQIEDIDLHSGDVAVFPRAPTLRSDGHAVPVGGHDAYSA